MATVESLLSWEPEKLDQVIKESVDVAKLVKAFKEFLTAVGEERQRFANDRNVLNQQIQVTELNSEQRFSEMERQIFELSGRLQIETESKLEFQNNGAKAKDELCELKNKVQLLLAAKSEVALQLQTTEADSANFKLQLEDALRRLQFKEDEMKRLNVEWDQITQKEAEMSKLQAELRAKLSDVESRDVSLKFREDRLSQEKDIVTQQNTWLTDELTAKTDELSKLRQTSTETLCKLKSELAERSEEVTFLKTSHNTLKQHVLKLEKKSGELINKLQDKDTDHLAEIDNIRLQLNKQERLTELYSCNCEEYQSKIKDLTNAIEEMQMMLKTSEESAFSMEQHCENEQNKFHALVKELQTKITSLQNELDNANDLLLTTKSRSSADNSFDLSQLSSTAVTVGGLLKTGMTITQMYSAYVETTESLALEKDKSRLQSQYLDQILKEIEEKAPLLQQQRVDYENALLNQDNLANKLEKAIIQVDHYRIAYEESQNASNASKRETDRYKTQIKDFSQQIQVLVKEVEDARAGRVSRSQSPAINSSRVSSSSQVISDQLVSFRSVAELQQQNSKLLCVVRELSEEQERRETEEEDPKILDLRAKLDSSGDQIKELRCAHQRQVEMVEAVARQRDMYRVLLAQAGTNMGPVPDPKTPNKEEAISKYELALNELQKEFSSYKKEKQDQIALVQEQLDVMRTEHSCMLTEKTKLSSRLEFGEEKYNILDSTYNTTKSEIKQYKDRSNELSSTVLRLQLTNDRLQNETITYRDDMSKLHHSLEGQRKTVELLRVNEIKQRTQSEAFVRESRTQNMLLSNLQTIHNNLERQEFERKGRTQKKMDLLESALTEARRKLQSTELRYRTAEAIQNTQLRDLKNVIEKDRNRVSERQSVIDKLQGDHEALLAESAQLKVKLETAEYNTVQQSKGIVEQAQEHADEDVDDTIAAQATRLRKQNSKITELQHRIIEMSAREQSLRSQVDLAKQHAEQYKGISEAHELALTELSQSELSVKTASERLITQNTLEITTLTDKLRISNEEQLKLQMELDEHHTRGSNEIREISGLLKKTQLQLEETRQREEAAITLENDIRTQFNKLTQLFEHSQGSLTEQRDSCKALQDTIKALEKQVTEYREKSQETAQCKTDAEKKLEEDTRVWNRERRGLELERSSLTQRTDDLQQQNALLHSQLETLSKDVVDLQKALTSEQPATETSTNKTNEELWEIIRYVRREKDILSTKIDVADSESVRYKNRCDFLEKQLQESRRTLEEERAKSDSTVLSNEKHQEILKKVEETQALTEKVKTLSEERSKLSQMTALLKQQIAAYEKQLKPLKAQNREFVDKVSILQTQKEGLKRDVDRWSTRTNELIEQCNKVDAKEFARLQAENNKLKIQAKKARDDHVTETNSLKQKQREMEEESSRVSEEKRQLLSTINSMKADGTKIKIELNNVNGELKTSTGLVTQQRTDIDKMKKDQVEVSKELADTKKVLEDEKTAHQQDKDAKDDIIQKLRMLARNYKTKYIEAKRQSEQANTESSKPEESQAEEVEKIKRMSAECINKARQQIETLTTTNKELETKIEEGSTSTELLKMALESANTEKTTSIEASASVIQTLQEKIESMEQEINGLRHDLQENTVEMERVSSLLSEKTRTSHAETNTDWNIPWTDQQTKTEDTPTASVKPTTIIGLSTPTAAVRPTSMAPDIPLRMATVTPTTSIHISPVTVTPTTSIHISIPTPSNTATHVSSSSVQSNSSARSDNTEVTTGEVRATLRTTPRAGTSRGGSRDDVSSAGYKRSRCELDEDEQPGPSTKIAMVTSSAHIHHVEHVQTSESSEVTQSTPVFGVISSASQSSHIDSPATVSQVSSSEHAATPSRSDNMATSSRSDIMATSSRSDIMATSSRSDIMATSSRSDIMATSSRSDIMATSSRSDIMATSSRSDIMATSSRISDSVFSTAPDSQTAAVTSSETLTLQIASLLDRDLIPSPESNEATPAREDAVECEEDAIMRDSGEGGHVHVIEINSDSEEGDSSVVSNEDDVYSGLEEVEEDSRQLQFSFVQSSGTDPHMDILSEPDEHSSDLLEDSNNEATEAAPVQPRTVSLRPGETPWAHLSDTTTTQATSSSASNVRSIRRIRRQPPKKE